MSEGDVPGRRRKIWAAILVVAAVALLALAACAYRPIYHASRIAQESADGAALGGAIRLAGALQQPTVGEAQIVADMMKYATLNGLDDHDRLVAYYLDAEGHRLGRVGSGIPQEPHGLEAVVTVRVPTLLTRIFGLDEWAVRRQTWISLEGLSVNMDPVPSE